MDSSQGRPRVALVLGAGGTRGWAHVGVLRVLQRAGVPIDLVVGASAGALMGALYAARGDAEAMERAALACRPVDFIEWFLRGLRISPEGGRMARLLWQAYGRLDIREMAVPFAATALDVETGQRLVLREGSAARAVEASIRPPLLLPPLELGGRYLVDGGLQSALPVEVGYDLGAAVVVAVSVGEFVRLPPRLRPLSARAAAALRRRSRGGGDLWAQAAFLAELLARSGPQRRRPQVEVRPDLRGISPMWPWHIGEAVRRGERAARQALPAIGEALRAAQAA